MKERRYRNKEAKIEGRKEEGIEGKGVEKMRMMRKRRKGGRENADDEEEKERG